MGEAAGRQIELDVTKIAHGGLAVARYEGRVVFVSDAVPGERVLARVSDDSKKRFWRADTVRVLEPSPHRREHIWAAASIRHDPADRAGGAEFGHIALDHQRELKRQVLAEALQRMAGLDTAVAVEPLPGDEASGGTGWRTRVRLHVDEAGRLGPFAARSHRVVPVADLPLATEELRAGAPLHESFLGERQVDVLAPSTGGVRLVVGDQKPTEIAERVGGREFRLADTGFWQVHRHAAETLSAAVQGAIDESRFDPRAGNLDLYGGVGLLAAAVAERFGASTRIRTVESDDDASGYAAENLAEWVGARAETGRVDRWLRELGGSLDGATVVLDPPRAGAGREVVETLARLQPTQLVYVACDPVAFARDVATFGELGYRLESLRAFDLFPNTHHLEAVARLGRA